MFRYLPGVLLVQVVTLALFWVNLDATMEDMLLRAGLPSAIIACVTALWLSTLARMDAERGTTQLRDEHASERERLNREIERTRSEVMQKASADKAQLQERAHVERERLVKQTHKQLMQRERSISRSANLKVGLSFMAVSGLGVMMLVTNMMTLGLLTITTAGGALGGYLLRWKQSRLALERMSESGSAANQIVIDDNVIEMGDGSDKKRLSAGKQNSGVPSATAKKRRAPAKGKSKSDQ